MKMLTIVSLGIALGLSSLMLGQSAPLYLEIAATAQPEADRMTTSLRADGYTVKQVVTNDAQIHLRVGPYNSVAERDEARAGLALKGIKSVFAQAGNADHQLDASASAPTGSAGQQDAEAAALAKLGLSPAKTAPQSQAEIEAEALKAMQTNTEREAAEAEKRRLAAEAAAQQAAAAAQQAEADRLQREIESQRAAANAPPQQSTAASFLNALNGVLSAGIDTYAQQQAANEAANQARLNQIATLRAQQAQIEANRAAEQRRQQLAAQVAAKPSVTQRPQSLSSTDCDDARDHLPPGSTMSAYQGCIPYKGTQISSAKSNRTGPPGETSGASSSAITRTASTQSTTGPSTAAHVDINSSIAPPPTCVDLGSGNCMPLAQNQQLQGQKNQQGVILNTLCPASGFVPGVMTHPAPDVALGVQCKPGSVIYINGMPQFDTTGTGLGPVTHNGLWNGASGGGSSGLGGSGSVDSGSGNGGISTSPTDGPSETRCIQLSSDPTNTYPVFHNLCSFPVKYFWTPFTVPPGGYAQQNGILQPGETQTGVETAVGGYRVYACQTNYIVVGTDGSPITGVVNGFRCVKP